MITTDRLSEWRQKIEAFAALSRNGLDVATVRARLRAGHNDPEWMPQTITQFLHVFARYEQARTDVVVERDRNTSSRAATSASVDGAVSRYSNSPVGSPDRPEAEARAAALRRQLAAIDRDLAEADRWLALDDTQLLADARKGFAIHMAAALSVHAEDVVSPLEESARRAASEAANVLALVSNYEAHVAFVEQEAGHSISVPRPTVSQRAALAQISASGGSVRWDVGPGQAAQPREEAVTA